MWIRKNNKQLPTNRSVGKIEHAGVTYSTRYEYTINKKDLKKCALYSMAALIVKTIANKTITRNFLRLNLLPKIKKKANTFIII